MTITRRARVGAAVAALTVVGVVCAATITTAAGGTTATAVVAVTPARVLDTRNAIGVAGTSPVGPGDTVEVQIAGVGPVPADAVGVVLNVTGTQASEETYVTTWPTGEPMPVASSLNLTPGINAPNAVTARLGDGGRLSMFNFTGTTHLIADVTAYLVAADGSGGPPGPAGPVGPRGPAGPGPIVIDASVAWNTNREFLDLDGLRILVVCQSDRVIVQFNSTTANALVMQGIATTGTTPAAVDERAVNSLLFQKESPAGPVHYTGFVANSATGDVYDVELHVSRYDPCAVRVTAIALDG